MALARPTIFELLEHGRVFAADFLRYAKYPIVRSTSGLYQGKINFPAKITFFHEKVETEIYRLFIIISYFNNQGTTLEQS